MLKRYGIYAEQDLLYRESLSVFTRLFPGFSFSVFGTVIFPFCSFASEFPFSSFSIPYCSKQIKTFAFRSMVSLHNSCIATYSAISSSSMFAIFSKGELIKGLFGFAFGTDFCYDLLRHFNLLHRLSCSEPVGSTILPIGSLIITDCGGGVKC